MTNSLITPATVAIPSVGSYRIDSARSAVTFTTRHLFGLGGVRGGFDLRDGEIRIVDPVHGSSVRATISAASFRSGNASRDAAALSERLLDAAAHPWITFASRHLEQVDGRWILSGLLSVCGNARPLDLYLDAAPTSGSELRLAAVARVDRNDFGVTGARGLAARHLDIRLDIVASRA